MSSAMIRGLALVEAVGQNPGTVSDLARRVDLDKAIVSRLVASAEAEGWLVRRDGIIVLGPRAAALGQSSGARDLERLAHELAHALAGVTGLDAMVHQYTADRAHLLAIVPGVQPISVEAEPDLFPLFTTAVGLTFAAQFDDEDLERRLSADGTVDTAIARARVAEIRGGAFAREDGEYKPGVGCFALPWMHPHADVPSAISLIGPSDEVRRVADIARRALAAAVQVGASRGSVVAAAAG